MIVLGDRRVNRIRRAPASSSSLFYPEALTAVQPTHTTATTSSRITILVPGIPSENREGLIESTPSGHSIDRCKRQDQTQRLKPETWDIIGHFIDFFRQAAAAPKIFTLLWRLLTAVMPVYGAEYMDPTLYGGAFESSSTIAFAEVGFSYYIHHQLNTVDAKI